MSIRRGWIGFCVLMIGCAAGAGVAPNAAASPAPKVSKCQPSSEVVCVTRADSGRTIRVRLAQTVKVIVSETGLDWSKLREIGPQLLRPDSLSPQGAGELAASYKAVGVGRTTLQATGAPICAPGKACPQFLLLWRVAIIVTA
jgi:hypothetical protein